MNPITINPTSRDSAECDPLILRETERVRLIFRPLLVNSIHDRTQAVKGQFIYQRKKPSDEWEDIGDINLSKLKGGDGVQLEIGCDETQKLVQGVQALYDFHSQHGVPRDTVTVATSSPAVGQALQSVDPDTLEKVLEWVANTPNPTEVVEHLARLDVQTLQQVNTILGISSLKNALAVWATNQHNSDEEFWQQQFQGNPFVFSQVFTFPVIIVKGKAYVGGKSVENTGGNVVDYLCKNSLTKNAVEL